MQPTSATAAGMHPAFQSSPAPKGRCNFLVPPLARAYALFQSSPAPKGRCNARRHHSVGAGHSFQSSPAPKGRCNGAMVSAALLADDVSILTGPEGPMQRHDLRFELNYMPFQSSPAPKGRCNISSCPPTSSRALFQSSPAPKGRCNENNPTILVESIVSILTGPEGPMQPNSATVSGSRLDVSILTGPEGPMQPC